MNPIDKYRDLRWRLLDLATAHSGDPEFYYWHGHYTRFRKLCEDNS